MRRAPRVERPWAGCRELVGTALVVASDSLIDPSARLVSTASRSQPQGINSKEALLITGGRSTQEGHTAPRLPKTLPRRSICAGCSGQAPVPPCWQRRQSFIPSR